MVKKNKLTLKELQERQKWTLAQKIDHSLGVIDQFLSYTKGQAYVSFSGGKDSTILLHLCRIIKPNIKAVFVNTGVEYPDILKFVKKQKNVEILYPSENFTKLCDKYGFPLVSKEQSRNVWYTRNRPKSKIAWRSINSEVSAQRISQRYLYLLNTSYDICNKCCHVLKKEPLDKWGAQNNMHPIMGLMAEESMLRKTEYLKHGCNNISSNKLKSNPLSIWLEQDIWDYIKQNNIEIAEVYNKGAKRTGCAGCAFGAHLEKQSECRYKLLYDLYPKFYLYFMNIKNNGVTYREAIRELFNKMGTGRYLPDEKPLELFD